MGKTEFLQDCVVQAVAFQTSDCQIPKKLRGKSRQESFCFICFNHV